jgi:hypothetical protein
MEWRDTSMSGAWKGLFLSATFDLFKNQRKWLKSLSIHCHSCIFVIICGHWLPCLTIGCDVWTLVITSGHCLSSYGDSSYHICWNEDFLVDCLRDMMCAEMPSIMFSTWSVS